MTIDRRSLATQLVLSFVALTLLTALAVGLPALWQVRGQLDRQAWAQVEQGRQAAAALYAARQEELASLATLTAQRPTLRALGRQADRQALTDYLETLRQGAGLDMVALCSASDQPLAAAGALLPAPCQASQEPLVTVVSASGAQPQAWLMAGEPVAEEEVALGQPPAATAGRVVVGRHLDEGFVQELRSQTGLQHTLLAGDLVLASSLPAGAGPRRTAPLDPPRQARAAAGLTAFTWDGQPYYAARLGLQGLAQPAAAPLQAEVALNVAGLVAAQQRLMRALLAGIALAIAVSSLLAIALARRISRPLADLAAAAAALSVGQEGPALDSPLTFDSSVREVALVGQALESARADLQASLDALRREKAWADHLLSAIVEGIVTLDRQGAITFFSHGAERITGWSKEAVIGRNCNQVFPVLGAELPFSALIPPPGGRSKITLELPGDRQAILDVTGARLLPPEGDEARVALVFRDISEEEAVHRLLSHFLATVSHEFRTPLSAVAASVELLLDQAPDLSPAELQELLTSLHLGVLNLQKLVDNLLESANIEAGRFRVYPRPVSLGEIIAEAIRTMQPLLDKNGQRLTVELPAAMPVVQADPRRIVQVLVNLLSNASNAQRGPDDALIAVGAEVVDPWVRVTVADRGPGIPPERRRELFRRFMPPEAEQLAGRGKQPGEAESRGQVGFGLGLSVVKAIVEAHGGQVGVDDRPGGGSQFWFTLASAAPLAADPSQPPAGIRCSASREQLP